jgi:RNA polymerase sigma-70 factor, ECF subfamily
VHLSDVSGEAYASEAVVLGDSERPIRARRVSADDAVSVEELAALYHEKYHRFVRLAEAITRDPEEARDAVQEAFSNALRELSRYQGRGSFEGWVWRCVMNAARMSRRKAARAAFMLDEERSAGPEQRTDPEPTLLRQIAHLPERQRLVLFLRYFADLPYDGIAEALQIAPGTVAATLHAAHVALRQRLEEADDA